MPFSYRNTIEAYQSLKEFATRRFPRALSTFEKSSLHRAGRWSAKVRCRSGGLAEEKDCDRATSVLLDASLPKAYSVDTDLLPTNVSLCDKSSRRSKEADSIMLVLTRPESSKAAAGYLRVPVLAILVALLN
jgi:hypothetical protein